MWCQSVLSTTMTTRAAIYCRISDDREGAGLGVERQEKDCRKLAADLGWDVAAVYVDNDLSAYNRRKPRKGYLSLLADVEARTVTGLVAWHNDRLHRSSRELEDFIDVVEASGAAIQTVKAGRYDLTTPAGRLNARLIGAVAQYESEQKAVRNRAKALQLADAGQLGNGGPRPFGYQADRITIRDDEANLLREAYRDVLAGKGLATICKDWHARGVKTTQGRDWSPQTLKPCLLRARNMGWREHKGRLAAVAVWDPIVDEETWRQAKAILTSPSRTSGGVPFVRKYLLTGLLRCGLCGAKLVPHRAKDEVQRFVCHRVAAKDNCGRIGVVYEPAEDLVVKAVLARLTAAGQQVDPERPEDPTDALRAQIAAEEAKLERLVEVYEGDDDALEMRRAGQRHRERIATLRQQINDAAATQRLADPISVLDAWPDYDLHQRRAILEQIVERVDVGPAVRGRNYFDRDRLTVVWR